MADWLPKVPVTLPDKNQVKYSGPIKVQSPDPKVVVTKVDKPNRG